MWRTGGACLCTMVCTWEKSKLKKQRIENSKQILCGCAHGTTYYFVNPQPHKNKKYILFYKKEETAKKNKTPNIYYLVW